jgi:phenylacetate-CoA ligase
MDLCALRVVDGSGRDVPAGQDGEIVVSNLHNRAMVLLNYRLGDWGALATEPCPCGRTLPLLERLDGRWSEAIALGDGRVLPALVVGSLFPRELMTAYKTQIVHPGPGIIHWRIVPFAGVDREAMRSAIVARARDVLGESTQVEVEFVADIPPTPAGKFARAVRRIDDDPIAGD